MNESQIIGLVAGALLAAAYIALHLVDRVVRARKAKPGQFQLPFSPIATMARLVLMVVVVVGVLKYTTADRWWFAGTFAAIYAVFFAWEIISRWSGKK